VFDEPCIGLGCAETGRTAPKPLIHGIGSERRRFYEDRGHTNGWRLTPKGGKDALWKSYEGARFRGCCSHASSFCNCEPKNSGWTVVGDLRNESLVGAKGKHH
jgi:hypothetical protein